MKSQGKKEADPEVGLAAEKGDAVAADVAPQLGVAPAAGVSESLVEKEKDVDADADERLSLSKSRTSTRTNTGDDVDAGTIAGEQDIAKE